ncbi:hypothetical protein EOD10_16155 [Mesorhizobium sp. M7A.T.Ca.TU.009.01.3.2]|nr:hypothetical protein EOD10_16155 [Mesorhizobium sp. M7A.T.Ca.TU.009.01.3.2]RUV10856.1 hypothetical protein EOD00_11350 [Mesorhizobium sp. M7A.T.Ca.TU.009.01.3.1]
MSLPDGCDVGGTAPPSVLPVISPSRGEIGLHFCFRQSRMLQRRTAASKLPISPLEGEMPGRAEGGAKDRDATD